MNEAQMKKMERMKDMNKMESIEKGQYHAPNAMNITVDLPTGRWKASQAAAGFSLIHAFSDLTGIMPLQPGPEGRGYLDMTGGYKTGSFGTPTTSDLFYLSPALGYVTPNYDMSITIPYLFLTNKTAGQSTTEDGIGDIFLHGGYVFLPETDNGYSLYGPFPSSFHRGQG
jgi:hypothetical protein